MKLNRHLVLGAIAGGGVIASVILAFKAGTKAERILRDEYGDEFEPTLWEKAKVILPAAAPAIIGVAVTGIAIAIEITGNKAKAEELKRRLDEGLRKGEAVKKQFNQYRGAVVEEDGEEKDIKYLEIAKKMEYANVQFDDESGEVAHYFCLTWMKKPIYFWATWENVYKALIVMNEDLIDYNGGTGWATVSQFFELIDRKDLITPEMDLAGWQRNLLEIDCDCYSLPVSVDKEVNDEGAIDIFAYWGPWEDIQKEVTQAEKEGRM